MKKVLIFLINCYQKIPGPWHNSCRYTPTCSEYSKIAIERYVPLIEPNLSIAILEYSEQVGVYLQELCQGPGIF